MFKVAVVMVGMLAAFASGAIAAEDKGKMWCNDAHMKKMDDKAGTMSDAAKKKEAQMHLAQSKDAMKANDMTGCVKHMEEAHKAMGL